MRHPRSIFAAILAAASAAGSVLAASGNYLLVRRHHAVQEVVVAEIGAARLIHRDGEAGWASVPREQCVALLDPDALVVARRQGWLQLADGQRFPGQALSGSRSDKDVLVWIQSSWLGRMEVPLNRIEWVTFVGGAEVPEPGDGDVLQLANGDRLEGIVTQLGDPIIVEVLSGETSQGGVVELPLDRVAAVRMVTPGQRPQGNRLWLIDGTVVDANEVMLGDDGFFRVDGLPFVVDDPAKRIELAAVAAVQFDPEGMVPFASLAPFRVEGPPTRYVVPEPVVLDELAPLGLGRVSFRGPVSVRYLLPEGAIYLSAEAQMPLLSRSWGDCDLVIRVDDMEIFSTTLNARQPTASIGVPLSGATLTVEISEGSAGPIQDHVVLLRALVLIEP